MSYPDLQVRRQDKSFLLLEGDSPFLQNFRKFLPSYRATYPENSILVKVYKLHTWKINSKDVSSGATPHRTRGCILLWGITFVSRNFCSPHELDFTAALLHYNILFVGCYFSWSFIVLSFITKSFQNWSLFYLLPPYFFQFFVACVFKWSGDPVLWPIVFSQFLQSGFLCFLLLLISHTYSLHTQNITIFIWRASLAPNNGPKWMDFIWWQQHSHFRTNFSTKHTHGVKYMYQFNNTLPDSRRKVYEYSTIHCNAELQPVHTDCYNTLNNQCYTTYRL
jgi:hypothetical protein